MSDFGAFTHLGYIPWLVAGFVLCAAETLAPGAFLIWIGVAALIVGTVQFVWPLEFTAQLFLFAALAVALVVVGRRVYGSLDRHSPPQPLSRAHGLIGKEFFLDQPIERGFGNIRVDDSVWRVTGEDMAVGEKVRVTGVEEGSLLRVAKA
jgi:inner membrane protein